MGAARLACCALAALLLAGCAAGDGAGDFRFLRHDGRFAVQVGNPAAARAAGIRVDGSARGEDVFGVARASAPAGMHAQVMQLRFRSRGFFAAEPGAHLAIGVTGAWRKDDPATPEHDGLLVGRGVVIGNVSGADHGCAAAPTLEIESFRRRGNRLYADSCGPTLRDEAWYRLTVVATRDGGVAWRLADDDGRLLGAAAAGDAGADVPPDLGGWWLLHVFADRHPARDWSLEVEDLTVRWRPRLPPP